MLSLKTISAGTTVSDFLTDINANFANLQEGFTNLQEDSNNIHSSKQDNIYVMTINSVSGDIEIDKDGVPTGGKNGDIVIVYE